MTTRETYSNGHLTAKPNTTNTKEDVPAGTYPLKLAAKRDGVIYVPKGYNKSKPAAFALMLHGAGGNADHGLGLIKSYADAHNIIIVSPASRLGTWDIIARDVFDADVVFIDQALNQAFDRFNIDTTKIAIGGFSDGASYALSLGLGNGNLFTHIIAFSPGFYHTTEQRGKPPVFISHGVKDHVLPIDPCSRRIVPRLKSQGYNVEYKEFDGEHQIPASISKSAITWFLK